MQNNPKMPIKSAELTDWQSSFEQQSWFDNYTNEEGTGIKFTQFQDFLDDTIYKFFARFPKPITNSDPNKEHDATVNKFTYQQEIQLFKLFDTKNDHLIDREEFAHLCQSWLDKTYHHACALVVVDVQNDFIDGSLALINGPAGQDGSEVVPVINKLLDTCKFDLVAYTLDWHPADHIGFHENLYLRKYQLKLADANQQQSQTNGNENENNNSNGDDHNDEQASKFKLKRLVPKANVFDIVLFDEGRMEQKLWPIHCVQNSWGAQLHPKLRKLPNAIYVEKGTLSHVDAYSAFWDNMHLNETGLRSELQSRKITDVFFCGLALDYCVAASAMDSVKTGFVTFVVEDACRGIDTVEIRKRKEEMIASGILIVDSGFINDYLSMNNVDGSGSICDSRVDSSLIMSICYRRAFAVN